MVYDPPIEKRTTEQLINIIEQKEEWKEDVVEMTKAELIKKGVPIEAQKRKRRNRVKFRDRIQSIKNRATYTTLEKILIVLFGPILVFIFQDLFLFQAGEGFKRKNRQGLFYLIIGLGL
jgi:predicted transcriptional regulator